MTLHLQKSFYLAHCEVLAISQGHDLVEGTEQLEGILEDFPLVETSAYAGNYLGKEVKRVYVLKNVGLPVRDKDHVEFVQGLVYISHVVLLYSRVLGGRVGELGE